MRSLLKDYVDSLPYDSQFELAVKLVRRALPIWDNFADNNALTYRDTVVGLTHTIDRLLLQKTIDAVEQCFRSKKVDKECYGLKKQFEEPIVALQDADWELPREVQKTFYAVHTLLNVCLGKSKTVFDESGIYVSINQAVDALGLSQSLTADQINNILTEKNEGS